MKASELRIGGWYEITGMGHSSYEQFNSWSEALNFEAYGEGIQLTPKILQAAGFEYVPEGLLYADKHHCIYEGGKNSGEPWKFNPFCTIDPDCVVNLQYLHQLQNIIYCLTGQELEIDINLLK